MKKILLTLIITFLGIYTGYAQCTPDPTITDLIVGPPGTRYDTAYTPTDTTPYVVLPHGQVGQNYHEVLYVKIPADTMAFGQRVPIDYVKLDTILNMPQGLTINCNPTKCIFPGGTSGCLSMDGIPQMPDSLEMQIAVELKFTFAGLPTPIKDTIGGFYFVSKGSMPVSIQENGIEDKRPNVYPNPASHKVQFDYHAVSTGKAEISLCNIIGRTVIQKSVQLSTGLNTIALDIQDLNQGVYLYTISEAGKTFTGRLSISR